MPIPLNWVKKPNSKIPALLESILRSSEVGGHMTYNVTVNQHVMLSIGVTEAVAPRAKEGEQGKARCGH